MNVNAYIKSANSGYLKWEVVEADFNSVEVEDASKEKRIAKIRRFDDKSFVAEVDNLNYDPIYDEKEFTSRRAARKWCERLIKKDIETN